LRQQVGVISDTHGLLRDSAVEALRGVELILHAGDVGPPDLLRRLESLAPVLAVRGNVDRDGWARELPLSRWVEVGATSLYMLHDLDQLDLIPEASGLRAVIYGHSHRPSIEWRNGVLYLNPGSAGPRRFQLPISLARLEIEGEDLEARLVELDG
jgi:putative phosphoesterase